VYEKNADSVFRYCFLRVSEREIAIDIMQDTFTKYWNVLLKGEKVENDTALLFTIAKNLIIDWYRKKKSVSLDALSENDDGDDFEEFSLIDDTKNIIELETEGRYLIDSIKKLSKSYQQAVYLRYVEDLSPVEIGKILGVSESAASVRIHRGIDELKKITGYLK